MLFHDAYKGLKVFVTGHTGFKGSWLTQWLLELGADVSGFSLYIPSNPSHFECLELQKKIRHIEGDIRKREELELALKEAQPDIIFHLAAQAIVSESYKDPIKTFETNALGTANVLESARHCPSLKALVMITSDKCYENVEWPFGYRENDRLGGKDPYSASKACAENIIYSYWHSFFHASDCNIKLASVRAGNVIGGGDWATDRIIPDCMRAWAKDDTVLLRNPHSTRPWQHVLEPLSGYLSLGAKLLDEVSSVSLEGEAFNFGPDATVTESVAILVKELAEHWPDRKWMEAQIGEKKKEASLLKLSCDKALFFLRWQPTLSFAETVRFTASWYKNYYENTMPVKELTLNQIREYQTLARERNRVWTLP